MEQKDDDKEGDLSDEGEIVLPHPVTSLWSNDRDEQQMMRLRQLLTDERQRFEQLRINFYELKEEFLIAKNERKKMENEVLNLRQSIVEKNKLVENLEHQLRENSPERLRQRLENEWKDPVHRLEKDKQRLNGELIACKQRISYLEKELIDSVEKCHLESQLALSKVEKEKDDLMIRLIECTKSPEGQRIASLLEENDKLNQKLLEQREQLDKNIIDCEKIRAKLEISSEEYEEALMNLDKKVNQLRSQLTVALEKNNQLEDNTQNLMQEKENLLHEISRLEREKNAHQEKINLLRKAFNQEKDSLEKEFLQEKCDLELDRNKLIEEIKRLKTDIVEKDQEMVKIEKTMKDRERDFLQQIEAIEKHEMNQRRNVDKEKLALESRINCLMEERDRLKDEIDKLRQNLEKNSLTTIELQEKSMILEFKLKTSQCYYDEAEKLRKEGNLLSEEMSKLKNELSTVKAINGDLSAQRDRYLQECDRLRGLLENEQKDRNEAANESEKKLIYLRKLVDHERDEMRNKFEQIHDEYRRKHQDREEMKMRCKKYANLIEKLQTKIKCLEEKIKEHEKFEFDCVPLKVHKDVKKQFKDLKFQHELLIAKITSNHGNNQNSINNRSKIKTNSVRR